MTRRRSAALAALLLVGCTAVPHDPFAAAQSAMRRDDLLTALLAYDAVPVTHPRYPEACAGAAAIEVRLRRGQQLMLEGYEHRAERQDREALQCLERARDVWPGLPGVDALIAATEHRLERAGVAPAGVDGRPIRIPLPPPVATELTAADRTLANDVARADGPEAPLPPAEESVVLGLVAVEARLGRGELELAVVDLLELARRFPDDARVQRRLARVLHQRALLRYGQGALTAALTDWERVLAIEPDNREVEGLLQAVRAEAAPPASPR